MSLERIIAHDLLSIGAVFLRPMSLHLGQRHQEPHLLRQPPDPHRSRRPHGRGEGLGGADPHPLPGCGGADGTSTAGIAHAASWAT